MAVVLVVSRGDLERPAVALALVALSLVFTAVAGSRVRSNPELLVSPAAVAVELVLGAALLVGEGAAYGEGHAFGGDPLLSSVWPLAGVLSAGLALGAGAGATAGVVMGLSRLAGAVVGDVPGGWNGAKVLSVLSTTVLFVLTGAAAGFAAGRARRAERDIAEARVRGEAARQLHDEILQTLAVIQRRTGDADVARLAHRQERELRAFLAGDRPADEGLAASLRRAAAIFEDAFGARAEVVVADDAPEPTPRRRAALLAAVSEALTNSGKHGGARRITVLVEADGKDGLFCSVKDDGSGFEPDTESEEMAPPRSVRAKIGEVGGRVEVDSRPGRGTEIRMWLP